jgi:hypothetical protein
MLITREKLEIYRKTKGLEQVYLKIKRSVVQVTPAEWALIETFMLFVKLTDKGLNNEVIKLALEIKLEQYCEDEYTIHWLQDMALFGFHTTKPKALRFHQPKVKW